MSLSETDRIKRLKCIRDRALERYGWTVDKNELLTVMFTDGVIEILERYVAGKSLAD